MIGHYNYTVILTYIGTVFGFFGISFIGTGDLKMALICLMLAGLCDMFDGKIASTRKRTRDEKSFGIQIDSLSDLICFGVLPALIGLNCTDKKPAFIFISATYVLAALIRLAWFNVDEEQRQHGNDGARTVYRGLPVTTAALIFPLFIGSAQLLKLPLSVVCMVLEAVVAVLFLSPFSLKKPHTIGKMIMVCIGIAGLTLLLIGVKV